MHKNRWRSGLPYDVTRLPRWPIHIKYPGAATVHKKLKTHIFAAFFSCLSLPPTWTASLVFDPGFEFVIHSNFYLSFTLTSFTAFYFMVKPIVNSVIK
jgi:hypothetical protein